MTLETFNHPTAILAHQERAQQHESNHSVQKTATREPNDSVSTNMHVGRGVLVQPDRVQNQLIGTSRLTAGATHI
jgi:hypothetical protein